MSDDPTLPAFLAEVTSDEFWEAVEASRATDSIEEELRIKAEYRRQRAERAAGELRETPEEAVRQVIANGGLEGAPGPTPYEYEQLLAVARGEMTADEALAEYVVDAPPRRQRAPVTCGWCGHHVVDHHTEPDLPAGPGLHGDDQRCGACQVCHPDREAWRIAVAARWAEARDHARREETEP